MRESVTYQVIVEEGRAQDARDLLMSLGTDKLGAPDADTVAELGAIQDRAVLERLVRAVLRATTWTDLLAASAR
jgi:hypothetical protein